MAREYNVNTFLASICQCRKCLWINYNFLPKIMQRIEHYLVTKLRGYGGAGLSHLRSDDTVVPAFHTSDQMIRWCRPPTPPIRWYGGAGLSHLRSDDTVVLASHTSDQMIRWCRPLTPPLIRWYGGAGLPHLRSDDTVVPASHTSDQICF